MLSVVLITHNEEASLLNWLCGDGRPRPSGRAKLGSQSPVNGKEVSSRP